MIAQKDAADYCLAHERRSRLHPRHGCVRCLVLRQKRVVVSCADFFAYWVRRLNAEREKEARRGGR